jgi:hypothetical protein
MNPEDQTPLQPSSIPQQPDIVPVTEVPKPKSNSLIITLSVSLIVMGGVVVFLAYQNWQLQKQISSLQVTPSPTPTATTDPTADWKLFTSHSLNYSLRYPNDSKYKYLDCSMVQNINTDYDFILADGNSGCEGQGEGWIFQIVKYGDNRAGFKCEGNDESWKTISSTTKVDNMLATKCDHDFVGERLYPGPDGYSDIFIADKNILIHLSDKKYLELFNQILSTFKFVENNSGVVTKKIGYIKSIDSSKLTMDYIEWKNDPSVPNGFKIENTDQSLTNLDLSPQVSVSIISNVHQLENDSPTLQEFINLINQNENLKLSPFNIEIQNGKVSKIGEQYVP